MPIALVTGSGGLVGSESVRYYVELGFDVIGIDNDMRSEFFGLEASTAPTSARLREELGSSFSHLEMDIRDPQGLQDVFQRHRREIKVVIHTAAQPSHDWAARAPEVDFAVNATGTLNLLEATRRHTPDAPFVFCSTNKVYGDRPNDLPLRDLDTRLELAENHQWYGGIDTEMPIDRCTHSLFGVSKVAADLLVQEYGRYFQLPTVCFRGGCLTGPQHAGAKLHGFLAYLMRCTVTGEPYTIFGYGGKQVRDNIHARDVVRAFHAFHQSPKLAAVYNLGGGRQANISMLEAVEVCQKISGRTLHYELSETPRVGDHRWWVSDLDAFQRDYPTWELSTDIGTTLQEIYDHNAEHWIARQHQR